MTKASYAVAILLALTVPACAEDLRSANYFLPGCKDQPNRGSTPIEEAKAIIESTRKQWLCLGYLEGLVFGVAGKDFCAPKGVTTGQVVAVVVKYIEARPERMQREVW